VTKETQVLATTHSPLTLNYVPEESTQIVTRGVHGTLRITPLRKTHNFAKLREHFEPGELWYNVGEERRVGK
jgi:predicted ATPase